MDVQPRLSPCSGFDFNPLCKFAKPSASARIWKKISQIDIAARFEREKADRNTVMFRNQNPLRHEPFMPV